MTVDLDYDSIDAVQVMAGVESMLTLAGLNPLDPDLADTPRRFLKAWMELTAQPGDPADMLGRIFTSAEYPTDEMIAVGPIDFTSVCEHHLLPFTGTAWVAYVPSTKGVVGLSKIPRLVEHFARRPQVQERLTTQITDALDTHLSPIGAGCIIKASHSCMAIRGVKQTNTQMVTSVLRGAFHDDPTVRAEFLALTRA